MNMPGFTAETSLYQTNNHYRGTAGGSVLSNGNTTITPQGCGVLEGIVCAGVVVGVVGLCGFLCAFPPTSDDCFNCIIVALPAGFGFCFDCVLDSIGGGGGGGGGGPHHAQRQGIVGTSEICHVALGSFAPMAVVSRKVQSLFSPHRMRGTKGSTSLATDALRTSAHPTGAWPWNHPCGFPDARSSSRSLVGYRGHAGQPWCRYGVGGSLAPVRRSRRAGLARGLNEGNSLRRLAVVREYRRNYDR